jgi:hypothetical protein
MFLALGIIALLVVLIAVGGAMLIGAKQAREEDGPPSKPTDFVKKSGSGEYAWRGTSESTGEFQSRVAEESREAAASSDPKSAKK